MSDLRAPLRVSLLPVPRRLRPATIAACGIAAALLLIATMTTTPLAGAVASAAGHSGHSDAAAAPPVTPPTKDAMSLAELVRARWLGVDHLGNLWGWNAVEGSVRFFSPTAEPLGTLLVPKDSLAADGDLTYGAVALVGEGAHLVWVRPNVGTVSALPQQGDAAAPPPLPVAGSDTGGGLYITLPHAATWVSWIDADTVAVAPQQSADRVEIWSLKDRKLLRGIGKEKVIVLKPGANRVRAVQIHFDPTRRLLYTLETFTGDLAVYRLDGTLAWHAVLDNPWHKIEEDKLAVLDTKAKVHDTAYPQAFTDLWLGEGPDGSAWVRQGVDILKQTVFFSKVTAASATPVPMEKVACPSRSFTIWGDHMIFFKEIFSPRAVCNSALPLP